VNISVEKVDSRRYLFSVRDNGGGIEPQNSERIFAPLKRLHGQEIPGTGIGLQFARKLLSDTADRSG
jgi:signal transduction histidine kinase